MVIWYVSKYASPQKYFFGTRHFYLAEEWVKTKNEVIVFTSNSNHLTDKLPVFKGSYFYEKINKVKTYWLNTVKVPLGSSSSIKRLLSWFDFERKFFFLNKKGITSPDVIIVSSLSLLTVLNGYYFSKKYNCKFVFEVRDIWPLSVIELGSFNKNHPFILFLSWIEKFGYKNADIIVGTMPNLKEHVENVIGITNKCHTIPQGYNPDFYKQQSKLDFDYINKYIPKNKFIIAYAGTLNINNPISVLLESASILRNENIGFLIVGDGNNKENLIELSKDLPNVIIAPKIPKDKVNHLLSFSSICFDSFSSELAKFGLSRNKWIDYMYAGKPIICSYSGFKSMINESNSGSFVEFNNSKLLAKEILMYSRMNKEEIDELGVKANRFIVENRSFKKLARNYLDLMNV